MKLKPETLTQHVIPKVLHGVNLRLYWGNSSSKWKNLGKEIREKQNNICIACGREVPHKNYDWLELHEEFSYDYVNKIARIDSMVCLCGKCHRYIHQGNLRMQLLAGIVSIEYVNEVISRGDKILEKHNLKKQQIDNDTFNSPDWKLIYQGEDLGKLLVKKKNNKK